MKELDELKTQLDTGNNRLARLQRGQKLVNSLQNFLPKVEQQVEALRDGDEILDLGLPPEYPSRLNPFPAGIKTHPGVILRASHLASRANSPESQLRMREKQAWLGEEIDATETAIIPVRGRYTRATTILRHWERFLEENMETLPEDKQKIIEEQFLRELDKSLGRPQHQPGEIVDRPEAKPQKNTKFFKFEDGEIVQNAISAQVLNLFFEAGKGFSNPIDDEEVARELYPNQPFFEVELKAKAAINNLKRILDPKGYKLFTLTEGYKPEDRGKVGTHFIAESNLSLDRVKMLVKMQEKKEEIEESLLSDLETAQAVLKLQAHSNELRNMGFPVIDDEIFQEDLRSLVSKQLMSLTYEQRKELLGEPMDDAFFKLVESIQSTENFDLQNQVVKNLILLCRDNPQAIDLLEEIALRESTYKQEYRNNILTLRLSSSKKSQQTPKKSALTATEPSERKKELKIEYMRTQIRHFLNGFTSTLGHWMEFPVGMSEVTDMFNFITNQQMNNAKEKGYINPDKSQRSDYHPVYTEKEVLTIAYVVSRSRAGGINKRDHELYQSLIDEEVQNWYTTRPALPTEK